MRLVTFDVDGWRRDGYLHMPAVLAAHELKAVRAWTEDIAARSSEPGSPDGLLQHYELTERGPQITRSENLVPNHVGFASLVDGGLLPTIAAELLGEPVLTYAEKIDHKLVGGAGSAPHQDARAYELVDTHLSCMVAIDDATVENGCIEVVAGRHHELLDVDADGSIDPHIVETFTWQPIPLTAGDLLWFHSLTPQRSGPNRSERTRRGLFCTYSAASLGDLRRAHDAEKLEHFARHGDAARRVSTTIASYRSLLAGATTAPPAGD